MSAEPRTKQFEPHELMQFLDRIAADMRAEQGAQLASLDLVLPHPDASDPRAARSDEKRVAEACLGTAQPAHRRERASSREPERVQRSEHAWPADVPALERTVLDLEPPWHAEPRPSWLRPVVPTRLGRVNLAVVGALACFCLVLASLADSLIMRSITPVDRGSPFRPPPPLPTVHPPRAREAGAGRDPSSTGDSAEQHAAPPAIAAPQPSITVSSSRSDEASSSPRREASVRRARAPTPHAAGAHAASERRTARLAAQSASAAQHRAATRRAVDLLLSGQSREALDAYRALAEGAPGDVALSEAVRLLEAELHAERSLCEDESCAP